MSGLFGRVHQSADSLLLCIRSDEVKLTQDVLIDLGSTPPNQKCAMECSSFTQLPGRLRELLRGAEIASLLGIAPEVRRAWITVDNRLWLWDYGSLDQTFESCVQVVPLETSSDFIVCASIVRPRNGIFVDGVNYLLVVVTTSEVLLMALSYGCSGGNSLGVFATPYTVDTEGVIMLSVTGSPDGRIFMGGSDGNLYELFLDDSASSTPGASPWEWSVSSLLAMGGFDGGEAAQPRAKCRKIKHNVWRWRAVHLLLPPFIARSLGGDDDSVCLQHLVMDAPRGLLYASTKSSNLSVFRIANGAAAEPVARDYNVSERAAAFVRGKGDLALVGTALGLGLGSLVGIHVSRAGGGKACLLAVFASGTRVFLALDPKSGFSVIDVRNTSGCAKALAFSFYEGGSFIGCSSRGGLDPLVSVSLGGTAAGWREDYSTLTLPRQQGSEGLECAGVVDVKSRRDVPRGGGALLALLAAHSRSPSGASTGASPYAPLGHADGADYSSLRASLEADTSSAVQLSQHALQTFGCPQEYLLLSPAGMAALSLSWPVDALAKLLRASSAPAKSDEVVAIFSGSGPVQACAMCLLLAVNSSESLQHKAVRLAVHLGGEASCGFGADGSPIIKRSAIHDGMYLLAARLLRPLWFRAVFEGGGVSDVFSTNGSLSTQGGGGAVECMRRSLAVLCDEIIQKEFVTAFKSVLKPAKTPVQGMTSRQLASCARCAEEASVYALYSLLQRLFQALALIEILQSNGYFSWLTADGCAAWRYFDGLALHSWVSSDKTAGQLRSTLVSSLATTSLASEERISTVMRLLHDSCSGYFSVGDYASCLAMRHLYRCANGLLSSGVAEVLSALLRCSVYWKCDSDVCGEGSILRQSVALMLRMGDGRDAAHAAVILYLTVANTFGGCAVLDAAFLAARSAVTALIDDIERESTNASDGMEAEAAVAGSAEALRGAVYGDMCALMLKQDEQLLSQLAVRCLESGAADDPLLARLLCEGLHAEHIGVMLGIQTPLFETYLESADPPALHQYFEVHGRLREAAVYMDNLASADSDCLLEVRILYFQRALGSALKYLHALQVREVEIGVGGGGGDQEEEEEEDTIDDIEAYVEILRSRLVTARYQLRLLRSLGSSGAGVLRREEESALQLRRADESYLFREVGLKYGQFDVCLLLLCAAPHLSDDPELTERLARSLVYRLLPQRASSGSPADGVWRDFLLLKAESALPGEAAVQGLQDTGWAENLEASMAGLGKEMFGSTEMAGGSAENNFPLHVFVGELVDVYLALRRAWAAAPRDVFLPREGFAGSVLRAMGVSPSLVAEGFLRCLDTSRGCSLEKQSLLVQLCVLELKQWAAAESTRESLLEFIRSGRMEVACGAARSAINSLLSSLRTPPACLEALREADDELSAVIASVDALVTTHR